MSQHYHWQWLNSASLFFAFKNKSLEGQAGVDLRLVSHSLQKIKTLALFQILAVRVWLSASWAQKQHRSPCLITYIENNFFWKRLKKLIEQLLHISKWENGHIKVGKRGWDDVAINPTPGLVTYSQERTHKLGASPWPTKGSSLTSGIPTFKSPWELSSLLLPWFLHLAAWLLIPTLTTQVLTRNKDTEEWSGCSASIEEKFSVVRTKWEGERWGAKMGK